MKSKINVKDNTCIELKNNKYYLVRHKRDDRISIAYIWGVKIQDNDNCVVYLNDNTTDRFWDLIGYDTMISFMNACEVIREVTDIEITVR